MTRSHQTGLATSGTPLPDTDLIRRAALQASWARDRELARQRLALRWFAWILVRLMAIAALVAAATWLWLEHLEPSARNAINATPGQKPTIHQASDQEMIAKPHEAESARPISRVQPSDTLTPEGLRLEQGLPVSQTASHQATSTPAPRPTTGESPIELRPEPRLHTKEH